MAAAAPEQEVKSVQEGSRWRYVRPAPTEVSDWFKAQPLDAGMEHRDYETGIVVIPANEKVKKQRADGRGLEEAYEMTYTPYMRVDMRVLYFRRLAELRKLRPVIEPVPVTKVEDVKSAFYNANLGDGLWWHVVRDGEGKPVRYLVATWRVALYEPHKLINGEGAELEGTGTKQVSGGPDPNAIMKAETGAIGRALAAAGILVLGTGLASAEDMQDEAERGPVGGVAGPDTGQAAGQPVDPEQERKTLFRIASELERRMKEQAPPAWSEFAAWWNERKGAEGWNALGDVPTDALRGIIVKMERLLDERRNQNMPDASTGAAS